MEHETRRATPIARESPFSLDELFFSITDRRGLIKTGNEVFARVSNYSLSDMIGKPHNLIRHPDMPRCVFALLWDFIESSKPIAAYVKNMASDGSFYWVMAAVMPAGDTYVSVRLKPTSELFQRAIELYAELRALELSIEDGPRNHKAAMEASGELLDAKLASLGFDSYERFMRVALSEEISYRQAALGQNGHGHDVPADAPGHMRELIEAGDAVDEVLELFVARITEYRTLSNELSERSHYVSGLAEDIRLFSLNALLEAGKLAGSDGDVLGAVAALMRDRSLAAAGVIAAVNSTTTAVLQSLEELSFRIAISVLQSEGASFYVGELAARREFSVTALSTLQPLHHCMADAMDHLLRGLQEIDTELDELNSDLNTLVREIKVMRSLERSGRIEAARIPGIESFVDLFNGIGEKISTSQVHLDEFATLVKQASRRDAAAEAELQETLSRFGALLASS